MLSVWRLYALDSILLLNIAIVPFIDCYNCLNVWNFKPFQLPKIKDPIQMQYPLTWVFTPSTFSPLKFTETEKTKDTLGRSTATCVISFLEEPPTYLRQRKLAWHPPSPRQDGISSNRITKGTMLQVAKWGGAKCGNGM